MTDPQVIALREALLTAALPYPSWVRGEVLRDQAFLAALLVADVPYHEVDNGMTAPDNRVRHPLAEPEGTP
jgi:hypothetical protein